MSNPAHSKICPTCSGSGRVPTAALAEHLHARRTKAGIGSTRLATTMGISTVHLRDMELGRRGLSTAMAERYRKALKELGG